MKGLLASFVESMGRDRLRKWALATLQPLVMRVLDRFGRRSIAKKGAVWVLRDDAEEFLEDVIDETLDWLAER